jgi:hypothetical protein
MEPRISLITLGVAGLDGHLWEVAWNPFFPLDERGGLHLPEESP